MCPMFGGMVADDTSEDADGFYLRLKKPRMTLVLPKSDKFISLLADSNKAVLDSHGWNLPRILLLELPYMVAHINLYPTATSGAIVPVVEKSLCFRTVCFLKNYFSELPPIWLEDTVWSQTKYLEKHEAEFNRADSSTLLSKSTVETNMRKVDFEQENMLESFNLLSAKYGRNRVMAEFQAALEWLQSKSATTPVLTAEFMFFWFYRYCRDNADHLQNFSFPLSSVEKTDAMARRMQADKDRIFKIYREVLNFDIAD